MNQIRSPRTGFLSCGRLATNFSLFRDKRFPLRALLREPAAHLLAEKSPRILQNGQPLGRQADSRERVTTRSGQGHELIFEKDCKPSGPTTRRLILEAAADIRIKLPDNVGRHSFISMHVAQYESVDKSTLGGNTSPQKIETNYLDIVTRVEAAQYWNIFP